MMLSCLILNSYFASCQSIPLPHSGLSFHPSAESHQLAMETAAAVVIKDRFVPIDF